MLSRLFRRTPAVPALGTVQPARLIVGLGNPGADYSDTRHNAGFHVVEKLASEIGADSMTLLGPSFYGAGRSGGLNLGVAMPQTFMNRSGAAVADLLNRFGLDVDDLLVVTDDLALPVGQIRLRPKGGAGGHNGLQDIADALGSTVYPRLRIGVGNSFEPGAQVDYVLSPVPAEVRAVYDEAISKAAQAAQVFAIEGLTAAMNRFN